MVCGDNSRSIQGSVADRNIFQSDKTKLEDKAVLWELKERGNDAGMDSVDSVSFILPAESEVKDFRDVVYQFYFGDKDDAVSAGFPLRFPVWHKPAA